MANKTDPTAYMQQLQAQGYTWEQARPLLKAKGFPVTAFEEKRWYGQDQGVINDPAVKDAMSKGFTGVVDTPGRTSVRLENGKPVEVKRGSIWGPLALAAAGATAGTIGMLATGGAAPSTAFVGQAVGNTANAALGGGSALATAAPVAAAAAKSGFWDKLTSPAVISTGIQAGAGLIGGKMQADAQRDAANAEAEAAEKALDWQKQVYATRQKQLAPAIGVGNGATVRMGELMGIATPEGGWPVDIPAEPQAQSRQPAPAAAPAAPQPEATVMIKAPTGQTKEVPASQVAYYESKGATRV